MGVGFDPKWRIDEIPVMPKDRYRLMKSYMPTVGTRGLDMMFRTCTIQVGGRLTPASSQGGVAVGHLIFPGWPHPSFPLVWLCPVEGLIVRHILSIHSSIFHLQVNLDFESERDMIEKFRIGLALQPVAVALFANSPFLEGRPTGELSTRARVWMDVDKARTGGLPFVFDDDMSFERYVEYAMDVPMYFVYRKGKYINALGMSWRDFMEVRGVGGGWGVKGGWSEEGVEDERWEELSGGRSSGVGRVRGGEWMGQSLGWLEWDRSVGMCGSG